MKYTSGPVYDTIRKDYAVTATPKLLAEWNLNMFYKTAEDNTPAEEDEGYDVDFFPIESITMPHRPTAGIVKAMTNQALADDEHNDGALEQRYYTVAAEAEYKYWQSPVGASATAPYNFANHTDSISKVRPRVEYQTEAGAATVIKANKIYICIENSWAVPDDFDVQIKSTTGGAWTTIATTPAINSDGVAALYFDGAAWTTTPVYGFTTDIYAIQLVVRSMDKANAYFNLIELGARLQLDLTADLVDVNDEAALGEADHLTPLGTVSANGGNVVLFNELRKYTNDNPSSVLYNKLDRGVKFNLSYIFPGKGEVEQFEMYSDIWTESLEQTSVSLFDFSKILQERKPSPMVFESITVQEAVWRVCDSVGFNKYSVETVPTAPNDIISVFWTTGEESAWDIIQDLSKSAQCAVYFDSRGVMQIKTREAAFNEAKTPTWTIRQNRSGTELEDIVSLSDSSVHEANKIIINYQPTNFAGAVREVYPYDVVWQPEGTVTLRATELIYDLLINQNLIHIGSQQANIWPYEGIVQIEGEWISYSGKGFFYYEGGIKKVAYPKSQAELYKYHHKTPEAQRYRNGWAGGLLVKERGLYNSIPANHYARVTGWTRTRRNNYTTNIANAAGFRQNRTESSVTLQGTPAMAADDYFYVHRGNSNEDGYRYIGTRMRIDRTGHKSKMAGIFFNSDGIGQGYYVDIMPTSKMTAAMRKTRNEVLFYSMKSNGTKKVFGGEVIKFRRGDVTVVQNIGAEHAILEGKYFDLDIYFIPYGNGNHGVMIFVDGKLLINTVIPNGSEWKQPFYSRFGMFARGHSSASYEYIYGYNHPGAEYLDEETFFDRIDGGYRGIQGQKDLIYHPRTVRNIIRRNTRARRQYIWFFDEFGPIVHEARAFDVKYNTEGRPVIEAKLYLTNDTQAACVEFVHSVNGAKFLLANTSRANAVINGDDTLTVAGSGDAIAQKLLVYGRAAKQHEEKKVTKEYEWSIRRRGVIETEYQPKWIQSDGAANSLGNWLINRWAKNLTELKVEIFGNPLIELSDVVAIQYNDMTPATHKYFVTAIDTSFEQGITTELTLRRVL